MARSLPIRPLALAAVLAGVPACSVEPPSTSSGQGQPKVPPADDRRPEFIAAAEGDVEAVVREAVAAAVGQEHRVVVYVGAAWCEPCEAFHHAVERGELDDALAGVRFVEFDSDRDGGRLQAAGYGGRYIPRFVVPQADGRGSEQRIEGGIKGAGAVAHIMERLQPVLARGRG
jgi:thiol-disulfide isomerase/thioredoxin